MWHCPCVHKHKRRHCHAKTTVHWQSTHSMWHISLEILRFRSAIYRHCGHFYLAFILGIWNSGQKECTYLNAQFLFYFILCNFDWVSAICGLNPPLKLPLYSQQNTFKEDKWNLRIYSSFLISSSVFIIQPFLFEDWIIYPVEYCTFIVEDILNMLILVEVWKRYLILGDPQKVHLVWM